jgi:hypothetical protein
LCVKGLRADPQYIAVYLRMARKLLDAGHAAPARELLMDYAQRAKLAKTREGLEKLVGRPEEEVKRVLEKAISSAEQKVPPRPPRRAAPAAPPRPAAPPEPPLQPPPESHPKRFTVELGALDAEPTPELLKQAKAAEERHEPVPESPPPPEPEPLKRITVELGAFDEVPAPEPPHKPRLSGPRPQPTPDLTVPSPEDLQAPVLPPPPPAAPPHHTSPHIGPTLPPLPLEPALPPISGPAAAPAEPAPRPAAEPPPPRRPSRAFVRAPAARSRRARTRGRGWLWPLLVLVLLGAGVALVEFGVIPAGPLTNLLSRGQKAALSTARQASRAVLPGDTGRSDTIMARDTAGAVTPRPAPAGGPAPTPRQPQTRPEVLPTPPPALPAAAVLPPGTTLSRSVIVVQGLTIDGVREISEGGKPGFEISQVLPTGGHVVLREFPSDSAASGEISVSGLAADTVIGTTWYGGFSVTLRGVLREEAAVQLLQQLVEVRPKNKN